MIVLDTNVLPELMRPQPAPAVVGWVGGRSGASLFTTTITQAEILYGVALLPGGKGRRGLEAAVEALFAVEFDGRILPFDSDAARGFALLAARRTGDGHPMSQADAQIAAIARSRGADVATRNVADFKGCGVVIHNPWGE